MASALCNKSKAFSGTARVQDRSRVVVVRAHQNDATPAVAAVSRRASLASLASAAVLLTANRPALAAYGDTANVFGRTTNATGFIPYVGDGFAVNLPSKWNPSKQQEFLGTLLRYEDNFDAINYFAVMANPTDKAKISDYGSPDKFLQEVSYLLGQQSYSGETLSEGGFAPGRVAAASILDISSSTDKKGKEYYNYDILTRTADGDEGGKHQLIKATVSGGQLWVLKIQVGDKRWIRGVKKEAEGVFDSWVVA